MGRTVDVDLRIKAKNLSKATLSDIASDIDRISAAQTKQARSAADLAARTREELDAEQKYIQMAQKELDRRVRLVGQYKEQRAQVVALAAKLRELSDVQKNVAQGNAFGSSKQFNNLNKEIARTNSELSRMVAATQRSSASLASAGVNVDSLDADLAALNSTAAASASAYGKSTVAIEKYADALEHTNRVSAEARRRTAAEAGSTAAAGTAIVSDKNRARELAELRKDIEQRSEVTRVAEVQAEAQRRVARSSEQEAAARRRNIETYVAEKNRASELELLKQDIIRRSGEAAAATARESSAIEKSNARRDRLIALLSTERGQRIQEAEAARRETTEVSKNTAAKDRNAAATGRAAKAAGLFNDVGRKSLSTYQRIRGQVLGLVTAYVGVYEAINTVQKAITAVNRDTTLRAGLLTGSGGNQEEAAKNYQMLRREADRLGLVFDEVAPRFVNMDIAGRAAGLTANQTAKAFRNLSTAAAARNLSLDDTEGAFRAIEQMFSKGRVQAEELRGQLAERLPGAVAIFARANNMSLAQLDKALEKGQVGLDFVVKGLDAYAAQFDDQLDVITSRLSAYINRAQNAYNDWLRTLIDSNNQTRLKQAFEALTNFFRGSDGQKFAQDLGKALAAVIEAFIYLAQNADKVMTILKGFLALQAVKFFADLGVAVTGAAGALVKFNTGIRAAAAGTGAMSVAARALTPLLGPLGVAVAAVTAVIFKYSEGVKKAEDDTRNFIDALVRARSVRSMDEASTAQADLNKQLQESEQRLNELVKLQDATNSITLNPLEVARNVNRMFKNDTYTRSELEANITNELERQKAIQQAQLNLEKRKGQIAAEEADAARAAAMETVPTGAAAATPKDKTPKGPDPESVRDRILKMTEDLRAKLANAEIQSNARTAEQIEANYQSRLKVIEAEVQKAQINIDSMARDAGKANKGKGVDVTTELTTARGALDAYREAAKEAADRDRVVANIELREKHVNDLIAERDARLQLINTLMENGAITAGQAWQQTSQTTTEYNEKLRTAATDFLTFLQTIPPESNLYAALGIDKSIAGMKQLQAETAKQMSVARQLGASMGGDIAQGAATSLVTLGKGLAGVITQANSLGDAFNGAMDNFRNFAADFLQNIAQMILQAIILQAIQNAMSGGKGGYFGAIKGAFGVQHEGGIAGRANRTRSISPAAFVGAQRFHEGSRGVGLKPNEIPTILEIGEEVLPEDNPRHISNLGQGGEGGAGGGSSAPAVNLQNNIMLDPAQVVQAGISTPQGTKQLMSWLQANRGAVSAIIK